MNQTFSSQTESHTDPDDVAISCIRLRKLDLENESEEYSEYPHIEKEVDMTMSLYPDFIVYNPTLIDNIIQYNKNKPIDTTLSNEE